MCMHLSLSLSHADTHTQTLNVKYLLHNVMEHENGIEVFLGTVWKCSRGVIAEDVHAVRAALCSGFWAFVSCVIVCLFLKHHRKMNRTVTVSVSRQKSSSSHFQLDELWPRQTLSLAKGHTVSWQQNQYMIPAILFPPVPGQMHLGSHQTKSITNRRICQSACFHVDATNSDLNKQTKSKTNTHAIFQRPN